MNRETRESRESREMELDGHSRGVTNKVLLPDECYAIQGGIFDVYREMGCGFLEAVYQECLEKEFTIRQIPFESQKELLLTYKGNRLAQTYKPDFICYGKIIVELKAVKDIAPEHKSQLLNYLKATGLELGLLVNFGSHPKAEIVRMANTLSRFSRFPRAKKVMNRETRDSREKGYPADNEIYMP